MSLGSLTICSVGALMIILNFFFTRYVDRAAGGPQNLPQWEIEVLGNFSGNGLAVPVCNGACNLCINAHILCDTG